MLFAFLCLFFTSFAMADVVTDQHCADHEADCTATAGCYKDFELPSGHQCIPCEQDSYCPAGSSEPVSCSGKYTQTNSRGSTDKSECYRAVTCNKNPSGTMNCKVHASANSNDEGEWENGSNATGCSGTNYHLLWDGVSNVRCYANQWNCNRFGYSTQAEPIQGYPNWWVVTDCRDLGGPSVDGIATWNAQWQKWNISACRFDTSAYQGGCLLLEYSNDASANCYTNNLVLKPAATYIDMDDTIIYNWPDSRYECIACRPGYFVDRDDWQYCYDDQNYGIYDCSYSQCADTHYKAGEAICKCSAVPKGHYLASGLCNWADLVGTHISESEINNRCDASYCPAGQTTDSVGGTSVDACHYTADTQFCDARGCFSLSDIQDWTSVP